MRARSVIVIAIALAAFLRGTPALIAAGPMDVPCPMASHESAPMPRWSCCDETPAPVAPPTAPQAGPGRSLELSPLDRQLGGPIPTGQPQAALVRPADSPHDWRRLDLSVFLSVFLI